MKHTVLAMFIGIAVLSALFAGPRQCRAADEEVRPIIMDAIERFKTVRDYTCRLDKRVDKGGVLHEDLAIQVKYKKPAHYYFRWTTGTAKGREVIFAAGRYDDQLVAHPGGFFQFVTLRLDPEGRAAMRENRHSLHHSGLEQILHLVDADYRRARNMGLEAVHLLGERHLDDRSVWCLRGSFPEHRGFYAKTVLLYIDKELHLPVKISIRDGSGRLVEEYVFHELKLDTGLSEEDFDPGNPAYDFRSKKKIR